MDIRLFPPEEILETTVALPPSKSIGTRAMVLNFIAGATPEPDDSCDDTATLSAILSAGLPVGGTEVNVGPAGTAMRFLTALFAASEGVDCVLTGSERMLRRPIGPLVGVLRKIGADIEYAGEEGFPPLRIRGRRLAGGSVEIDASVSSQFISALMMITPLLEDDLSIRLLGDVQSMSYIRMTAGMMTQRGACIDFERDKIDISCSGGLKPLPQSEPDWSAAAFWYEISAVTAGWVTLTGISEESLQGDRNVAGLYERLGVLTSFEDGNAELSATPDLYNWLEADLTDMPDAVPSLVATCCLIGMRFVLTGIGALHNKECDRIEALIAEMAKLGCILETENYGTTLRWDGRRVPVGEIPVFDTYNDHRMAMALAPVCVFVPGIVIKNAEVVSKSYPCFWEQLEEAGFRIVDPSEPISAVEENA